MSQFDQRLKTARQRQLNYFTLVAAALVGSVLVVVCALLYTSRTVVHVTPADAARTASVSVVQGAAFAFSRAVYSVRAGPVIVVSAPGFRPVRRAVQADERGRAISVTLAELPGRLLATTRPADTATRWSLNGSRVTVAVRLERELAPGAYRVSADHPHYAPAEEQVAVVRGEQLSLDIPLRALDTPLVLESRPSGALVTLDGVPVGTTPLRGQVSGGPHRLELARVGYATISEEIVVTNDLSTLTRTYRLERPTARLVFEVSPPGGSLLVNGKQVEPERDHIVPAATQLHVVYFHAGYAQAARTIVAQPGAATPVRLHLTPELGRVEIRSRPQARVFIEGVEQGQTPLSVTLPARPHTVSLRRRGYRTLDTSVRPSSVHATVVDETLVTEAAAQLAQAAAQYTNSAGVALRLFHPTGFTMGAPRHEKGQRANEAERQVTLHKPFYAGKYEITNAEFRQFKPDHPGADTLPAAAMRWIDAAMFCNWLSRREQLPVFYRIEQGLLRGINPRAPGYRLPTEAEWEWLARRAKRSARTVFPWGNEFRLPPKVGNIADESARGTTQFLVPNYTDGHAGLAPVGSFPPEASGLYDLTGNVSEWMHDTYSITTRSQDGAIDPLGPPPGDRHVVKGSSWRSGNLSPLRAAYRDGLAEQRDDVGFRIARYVYGGDAHAR